MHACSNKEAMNFKESREGYTGGFGRMTGEEEMLLNKPGTEGAYCMLFFHVEVYRVRPYGILL